MLPYWLIKLLPMWDYICPRCRIKVKGNSDRCVYCGEDYGVPLRVPPRVLKDSRALNSYVHRYVFPRVSPWQRNYLTQYFTTIFSDGFESGDFTNWTNYNSGNVTPDVQSSVKHSGTYAAHAQLPTGGWNGWTYKDLGSSYNTLYTRGYFRLSTLPNVDGTGLYTMMMCYQASSGFGGLELRCNYTTATGYAFWQIRNNYFGATTDGLQAHANTWTCVELFHAANTFGPQKWWVDGVAQPDDSGTFGAVNPVDRFRVGGNNANDVVTFDEYWDDCVAADTYIGPMAGAAANPLVTQARFH